MSPIQSIDIQARSDLGFLVTISRWSGKVIDPETGALDFLDFDSTPHYYPTRPSLKRCQRAQEYLMAAADAAKA